jgi:hypothetical protein
MDQSVDWVFYDCGIDAVGIHDVSFTAQLDPGVFYTSRLYHHGFCIMEFRSGRFGVHFLEGSSVVTTILFDHDELTHGFFIDGFGTMDYLDIIGFTRHLG